MNKAVLVILMLLLAVNVNASKFFFAEVNISVDEEGHAEVLETYTYTFTTLLEPQTFTSDVLGSGNTIFELRNYNQEIYPHVFFSGKEEQLLNQSRSARVVNHPELGLVGLVELRYEVPSFAVKTTTSFGEEEWNVQEGIIQLNIERGAITIEPTQKITITVPSDAQIIEAPSASEIQGNYAEWRGPLVLSRNITVAYQFKRIPIPPALLSVKLQPVSDETKTLAIIALIGLALLFRWKKEEIQDKIRAYLITHSSAKKPDYEQAQESLR